MSIHVAYRGPYSAATEGEILQRLDAHSGVVSVDTETVSLKDRTCIGIGVAINEKEQFYFQVLPYASPLLPRLMGLLADQRVTKLYHNATFDLGVLSTFASYSGLPNPDYSNIQDTSIMAQVQGREAALQTLGYELGYTDMFSIESVLEETALELGKKKVNMLDVDWSKVALKCMNDVRCTMRAYSWLSAQWPNSRNKDCYEVDLAVLKMLLGVEKRGLGLNPAKVREYYTYYGHEKLQLEDIAREEGVENVGSAQQVGMVLAYRGVVLPLTKNGRQLRTDEDTLLDVSDPLASLVLRHRKVNKLLGTYLRPYLDADRAYSHFRIDLATGRLASAGWEGHEHVCRNLQNVPSGKVDSEGNLTFQSMRDIFVPDSGMYTNADFSQLEMRVFAHQCKDPTMLQAYAEGLDIHAITHEALWPGKPTSFYVNKEDDGQRTIAKTYNFSMIFDAQEYTLARNTRLPIGVCADFKNRWFGMYPGAYSYIQRTKAVESEWVETDFGRRMRLPNPLDFPPDHINKCKVNYPTQGTAADIVKRSMIKLQGEDYRLQVHDEHLIDDNIPMGKDDFAHIHGEVYTPMDVKHVEVWK